MPNAPPTLAPGFHGHSFSDVTYLCVRCPPQALAAALERLAGAQVAEAGEAVGHVIASPRMVGLVRYRPSEWSILTPLEGQCELLDNRCCYFYLVELSRTVAPEAVFLGFYDTAGGFVYRRAQSGCGWSRTPPAPVSRSRPT